MVRAAVAEEAAGLGLTIENVIDREGWDILAARVEIRSPQRNRPAMLTP